jgi:hypothetical protein
VTQEECFESVRTPHAEKADLGCCKDQSVFHERQVGRARSTTRSCGPAVWVIINVDKARQNSLWERFVLTNQYKISVTIGSFSVAAVLLTHFST